MGISHKRGSFNCITMYKLKKRETHQFELYNDLEIGDRVELGVFLNIDEGPKKGRKPVVTEQLWVEIKAFIFESKNIYSAIIKEQPLFLKQIKKGDQIDFAPENVLKARRKKPHKTIKNISGFVYEGKKKEKAIYKSIFKDQEFAYAIDPGLIIIRSKEKIEEAVAISDLDPKIQKELESIAEKFQKIEQDKYHVRVDQSFVKKSIEKFRNQSQKDSSAISAAIIRVSDRTFLPFNIVTKTLSLLKKMLIYIEAQDDHLMLYFKNEHYEGFINLVKQKSDSIIFDVLEK